MTVRFKQEQKRKRKEVPVLIAWMLPRDLSQVLAIETASFEFPWEEEDFIRCMKQPNCRCMVAEHNENKQVVGFIIYELGKNWAQVLNFAVVPEYRRQGIGTEMLAKMIEKLSFKRERVRVRLEIRERNLPAQLFLRANGFRAVRILHNCYEDTSEDAYVMEYYKNCIFRERKNAFFNS